MARFCTNCGAALGGAAHFCTICGARVKEEDAAPAAPPPPAQAAAPAPVYPQARPAAPPPAAAQLPTRETKCPWCGSAVDAGLAACPRCGATLTGHTISTRSGWQQLPGRKDMAKIQFGDSFCQIEGAYVPVADMNLAPGDGVFFTHHVLLWKDSKIAVTTMPLKGGWKRLFAGLPLIMTEAHGPGHIAFSVDAPGEMIALPLQPGEAVDVREHLMVTATSSVAYDWFSTNIWFKTQNGDDTETHYPLGMFMDRFAAPQTPGLLILHAAGNVFVRHLAPGQTILVKPTALIFKDPTVNMHLHFDYCASSVSSWFSSSTLRHMWLRLIGPGRIAVQSVFEHTEGEMRNMVRNSYATQQYW
jgi:uncharacterized protein (AIM24 family)